MSPSGGSGQSLRGGTADKRYWPDAAIALLIAVCVAVPYFASAVGVMNSMDGPQYALTRAIVDKGTLRIEGYDWVYPDFALVDSHMYSKRSPGVSFLAVPCYLYSRLLAPLLFAPYVFAPQLTHGVTAASPVEATTYGLASLISAADVGLSYLIMRHLRVSRASAVVAALLFGFGSLLWSYATSLVREPAVILFLLLGYLCVLKVANKPQSLALIGLGIASGLAVMCDNLALFPVLILLSTAFWILYRRLALRLLWILGGSLFIGLLPLCSYNLSIFGKPFVIQYMYDQNPLFRHQELHTLANPVWSIPVNLFNVGPIPTQAIPYVTQYHMPVVLPGFGVQESPMSPRDKLLYDWDQANSGFWAVRNPYKGLLIQSPVLFLACLFTLMRFRQHPWYGVALLAAIALFLPLCKISYFYNPNNFDTRYFLPATAFLFLPLGACFDWLRSLRGRLMRRTLLIVAALLALISLLNGWEGVLQNYAPHVSGQNRSTLFALLYPGSLKHPLEAVVVHTFPNVANLLFLLPVLIIMLGYALYLVSRHNRTLELEQCA